MDSKIAKIAKTGSLRGPINAKCYECIYDSLVPGTWRFQVENCASCDCPLYEVRPRSKSNNPAGLSNK